MVPAHTSMMSWRDLTFHLLIHDKLNWRVFQGELFFILLKNQILKCLFIFVFNYSNEMIFFYEQS